MIAFRLRPLAGAEPRALALTVVRYTPQAVLIANVEEARYRALASEDGLVLIEARYAVRNNQRSFLKVTMPAGATLWSARLAGRPIRPGVAGDDAVAAAAREGARRRRSADVRGGADLPAALEQLGRQGRHHADAARPRSAGVAYGVETALLTPVQGGGAAGAFRVEGDAGPVAEALRPAPPRAGPVDGRARDDRTSPRRRACRRSSIDSRTAPAVGAWWEPLPVAVTFPIFGRSLFLASELLEEGAFPSVTSHSDARSRRLFHPSGRCDMTASIRTVALMTAAFVVLVLALAPVAMAQPSPRPPDTPRGVTLTLTEYNRLLDLAARAPQPAAAPPPAVLGAADLRVAWTATRPGGRSALLAKRSGPAWTACISCREPRSPPPPRRHSRWRSSPSTETSSRS
jgi:hypothetical protein